MFMASYISAPAFLAPARGPAISRAAGMGLNAPGTGRGFVFLTIAKGTMAPLRPNDSASRPPQTGFLRR